MIYPQKWAIVGASVQGSAHDRTQTPCQDAHMFRELVQGQLLIAVADGAGSATHADAGAQFAARESAALLEVALRHIQPQDEAKWQFVIRQVFRRTYVLLEAFAEQQGETICSFATTLTLVFVTDSWLVIGQIGDGIVVVDDGSGSLTLPVVPTRGEYANQTTFLLSDQDALAVTCVALKQHVAALAVSTDGLLRLAVQFPAYQPFPPFFHPLFEFVSTHRNVLQSTNDIAAWLASDTVCARTDDDKTLVVAVRVK